MTNELRDLLEVLDGPVGWRADMERLITQATERSKLDKFYQPGMESFWISEIPCPACRRVGLFLGNGGYITCSQDDCPNPDYAESSKLATERAEVEKVEKWKSLCGCPMCEYHIEAYRLRTLTTLEGDSKS